MEVNKQVPLQQQSNKTPLKAIRILSIDGGGIRGVAVARILEEIEKRTDKKIHELFDVVVGTSTGGLLAVMMTVEIPPAFDEIPEIDTKDKEIKEKLEKLKVKRQRQIDIREELGLKAGQVLTAAQAKRLYQLKAKEIFHENAGFFHKALESTNEYVGKVLHWFSTKYEKGIGLKDIVRALYIKNGFEEARTCTGVVVTERGFGMPLLLNSTNAKVKGRHNFHNNLSLAKLVRATSAAPTYFKAVHIHNPVIGKEQEKDEEELEKEQKLIHWSSSHWDQEVIDHKFCQRQTLFFEDGGVTCNNPSLKGFRYAKELLKLNNLEPHDYQFQIYSFGTGAEKFDEPDPAHDIIKDLEKKGGKVQSGNWDSLSRLAFNDPFQVARQSYKNHIKVQERLKFFERRSKKNDIKHKYFRFQFEATKDQLAKLDDSSKKHIDGLIAAAQHSIDNNPVFEDIIASLDTPVDRPKDLNKIPPKIKLEDSKLFQCI